MTKPSSESKTAKRIWKRADRRSVTASTADIQVSASSGSTTQELHSEALRTGRRAGGMRAALGPATHALPLGGATQAGTRPQPNSLTGAGAGARLPVPPGAHLPWGPTGPSLPWAASSPPHPLRDPLPLSPAATSPGEQSSAPTPPARGLPGRLGTEDGGPNGLGNSEGGGEISGRRRFLTVQEAPGSEAHWREGGQLGEGGRGFSSQSPQAPSQGSRARTARWPQGRAFGEASELWTERRGGGVGGNQRTPQGEGRKKPVRKEDR